MNFIINKTKILVVTVLFLLFWGCRENNIILLGDPEEVHLSIDLQGGAFIDFRLTDQACNPFSWNLPLDEMPENNRNGAPFRGHFICLGRWGAPTAGEMTAGVPHNGQSGNQPWKLISRKGDSLLLIRSVASLDGIIIERKIDFDPDNAIFKVKDIVKSTISIGRPFNIVQHATVGAPFLSASTIIDSNAGKGFMQHLSYPDPQQYEYNWPVAIIDTSGTIVDLTRTDVSESYVSTHLFEESSGWITVSSPEKETMIGYLWKTNEYPWVNLWHDVKNKRPHAKGLEFGTTGIGRPYQDLLAVDTRFHTKNSFFYLDAMETVEKSFLCFQTKIPKDFKGVKELNWRNKDIILTEKDTALPREIIIKNKFSLH
ncbi:MAG: hypothetical protein LBU57_08130 [Dysgonamonadaceae bacterium]|jgi:hypothetical protein|nr:hypothetical protein [Dysgonamonadaceae bacterium]